MYVQLKKLMASKYSSSVCGGVFVCCIQSKHKSLGILLFSFLFCFTVCVALRMFLWTNRAVFCPPPHEWSQMHQRCQSLTVPQPWENNIYGNGKSIKHLSYCSPCSVVFMFKNDFVSSGWKNVKNTLLFENDNIQVLDFEIRSLNIKKKSCKIL